MHLYMYVHTPCHACLSLFLYLGVAIEASGNRQCDKANAATRKVVRSIIGRQDFCTTNPHGGIYFACLEFSCFSWYLEVDPMPESFIVGHHPPLGNTSSYQHSGTAPYLNHTAPPEVSDTTYSTAYYRPSSGAAINRGGDQSSDTFRRHHPDYHNSSSGGGNHTRDVLNYTSMLNSTSSSVLGGRGAPPSPIPHVVEVSRWSEDHVRPSMRATQERREEESGGQREGFRDPLAWGQRWSESSKSPQTLRRHLFHSASASVPRSSLNTIRGDTGRVSWTDDPPLASTTAPTRTWSFNCGSRAPWTSTYVGTSAGVAPASRFAVSHLRSGNDGAHPSDGSRRDGLVYSHPRAPRGTWEEEEEEDDSDNPSTAWSSAMSSSTTVSTSYSFQLGRDDPRTCRHRSYRRNSSDSANNSSGSGGSAESSNSSNDEEDKDSLSFADAIVREMDSKPVVPLELLQSAQEAPFVWNRHPSHPVILSLLQHRGIFLPRYRELVDYHMAELFLHYIDLCREGSYFVYYAPSKWPKERFFRIRMLPVNRLESDMEPVPHLVLTMHEAGVHIMDAIPLDYLVGVTATPQSACFRPFLDSPNTIIGCREGRGHRAHLPVDGAFSLWFYDIHQHTSRSVDLLTCDAKVFDIWTKTFRGLVSVNSSSIVQVSLTAEGESTELLQLVQAAQRQVEVDHGERTGRFS